MAMAMAMATLMMLLAFPVVEAQLLHPTDMVALRAIKSSMYDLPGGSFFATWEFALKINPCQSFRGLQCIKVGSFNRVISLALGPASAGTPGLGGQFPEAIGTLAYLQTLTISTGALRGTIPDSIGMLQTLKMFSVSPNYITGPIPATFANLHQLETLQIRKNELEGVIPAGIGSLRGLRVVILAENRLSGPVPGFQSTSLIHFDVHGNELSGGLPAMANSVEYFSVGRNRFSGEVKALEGLRGLSYLDLSFNAFSGGIPSAFFEFPQLFFLLLNNNQFRGAVSVPGLVSIAVVDLSHNQLQGIISPYLAGAQTLFLNHNMFVGTVPQDFASKMQESTLQSVYLQHNYLTNSGALGVASLPRSVAVCLQYNCMLPPPQSLCPPTVDVHMPAVRPGDQCVQATAFASPGD